eukprot:scaffold33730_cov124-Isochrysis_galbana.AAC.3
MRASACDSYMRDRDGVVAVSWRCVVQVVGDPPGMGTRRRILPTSPPMPPNRLSTQMHDDAGRMDALPQLSVISYQLQLRASALFINI